MSAIHAIGPPAMQQAPPANAKDVKQLHELPIAVTLRAHPATWQKLY